MFISEKTTTSAQWIKSVVFQHYNEFETYLSVCRPNAKKSPWFSKGLCIKNERFCILRFYIFLFYRQPPNGLKTVNHGKIIFTVSQDPIPNPRPSFENLSYQVRPSRWPSLTWYIYAHRHSNQTRQKPLSRSNCYTPSALIFYPLGFNFCFNV